MSSDFQLLHYYADLARRRAVVWLVPAALLFALGALYVRSMPRSYFSEAVIVVGSQQIPSSLVQSTVATERLQFIEQRVLARENLLKLVKKFGLFPELSSRISNTQLAQIVRNQITINLRATEASEQFAANSVFGIGVNAQSPDLAAGMASEIVAMIIEENRRARMSRAAEATAFLEREVRELTARVGEFDARVADFTSLHENALPSRLTLHLGEIRDGQAELTEIEGAIAEGQTNIQLLKAELALHASTANTVVRDQKLQLQALQA